MRAVMHHRYGPAGLQLGEREQPEPPTAGALVRVRAASVNPADWYGLTGRPWIARPLLGLRRPRAPGVGIDFAGTVEAVGKDVADLRAGDEVYGKGDGALAEYVAVADAIALKPANLTFEEAAAVPVAATTALQGLRDHGGLQPGQKVLINGASGGVGTFAVQIAKVLGGEVTAVCSTRNVELARSLGADRVIDYTSEDFTRSGERYDLLLDVAGSRSWSAYRRVLEPTATVVLVGATKQNRLLGPLGHVAAMKLASLRGSRRSVFFLANRTKADLDTLRELIEAGKVKPVIDRQYDLSDTADAFRYLGEGHTRGKVVIRVDDLRARDLVNGLPKAEAEAGRRER